MILNTWSTRSQRKWETYLWGSLWSVWLDLAAPRCSGQLSVWFCWSSSGRLERSALPRLLSVWPPTPEDKTQVRCPLRSTWTRTSTGQGLSEAEPAQTRTYPTHHLGEFLHFLHGADDFLFRVSGLPPGAAGRRHYTVTSFTPTPGPTLRVHTAQTSTGRVPARVLTWWWTAAGLKEFNAKMRSVYFTKISLKVFIYFYHALICIFYWHV